MLELFVAKLWRNLVKTFLGSRISRQDVVVLIYFSKLFFLFFIHLVVFLVLCFGIVREKNLLTQNLKQVILNGPLHRNKVFMRK